ncbi:MFS transporter [Nocardia zapadnayensis]|uniref:MFS transporter n=1 Tax=Nocardia rhamnosiphila TaxID=426716 RepID=UPI002246EF6F|nr:MFS transporter [Nocardia zapadnayensis]MCX0273518.1 MFS transporter [Nocardia zapadnayensis]
MVVATVSGRLSGRVPVRGLIGPGLLLVGVGLLAMSGLDAGSSWTRLIPGLILCGIGSGLVNPPLASTAVGVVPVQDSGMASGFNNTCRQIGIAVGIAGYGSLSTARLRDGLTDHLADRAGLAEHTGQLADAVHDGRAATVVASLPGPDRVAAAQAIHAAFAEALDTLFVVSGAVAVLGAVGAVLLIRSRDFLPTRPGTDSTLDEGTAAPVG